MSDEYTSKRDQLLQRCRSSTDFDIDLQIQCDCLNALDTQSRAFDKYTKALDQYNIDQAKWVEFNNNYGHILQQYQNLEKELKEHRFIHSYTLANTQADKECLNHNANYVEVARDGTTLLGKPGVGTVTCKYDPDYIARRLVDWRVANNLPNLVYKPPEVAPFSPGSVMCCQESMKNISNVGGSIDFNNIKQNCVAEIQQNIDMGITMPPSFFTPSSPSSPSSPFSPSNPSSPSSPEAPSSNTTIWIVGGVIFGILAIMVAIGAYRRFGQDEGGSKTGDEMENE